MSVTLLLYIFNVCKLFRFRMDFQDHKSKNYLMIGASNATKLAVAMNQPHIYIPTWDHIYIEQAVSKLDKINWSLMPKFVCLFSPCNSLMKTVIFYGPKNVHDPNSPVVPHMHGPQSRIRRSGNFRVEMQSLHQLVTVLTGYNRRIILMCNLMRAVNPICSCLGAYHYYSKDQMFLFASFESECARQFPSMIVVHHKYFVKDLWVPVCQTAAPKGHLTCRYLTHFYAKFLQNDGTHVHASHFPALHQYICSRMECQGLERDSGLTFTG